MKKEKGKGKKDSKKKPLDKIKDGLKEIDKAVGDAIDKVNEATEGID